MNFAQKTLNTSVNFVRTHKLPIAIVATAVTTAVVVKKTLGNQLEAAEDFIKDQGLYTEFLKTFLDEETI